MQNRTANHDKSDFTCKNSCGKPPGLLPQTGSKGKEGRLDSKSKEKEKGNREEVENGNRKGIYQYWGN
jgi:hypothetical protein